MMTEQQEKRILKNTFDMTLSGLQTDPYLAQKIIREQTKGEEKVKKKISFAFVLVNLLVLCAVTAFAVSIGTETPDKQVLQPAVTLSPVNTKGKEAYDILPLSEACEIAREALRKNYGVTDTELEQLMLYPYSAVGYYDVSNWTMVFYSNPNRVSDQSQDTYAGPLGEYRVVINGKTGSVESCEWYTVDFWKNAQRIWDAGNYEEVYRRYFMADFRYLPEETQAHFEQLLVEKGYAMVAESDRHLQLDAFGSKILLCDPALALPDEDPQVQAAWEAVEKRFGLDVSVLKNYSYIATRAPWESDTDDIVIAYNLPSAVEKQSTGGMDPCAYLLYAKVQRAGMFLFSFEKDTTHIVNRIKRDWEMPASEYAVETNTGLLLNRYLKWNGKELLQFHESYCQLEEMLDEMDAAHATPHEKLRAAYAYMVQLGSGNETYYRETNIAYPDGNSSGFVPGEEWTLASSASGENYVTLKKGHYGAPVQALQRELRNQGFYAGVADGYFGEDTETAVKAFQRKHSLVEDGIAGLSVQRLLYENAGKE